MQVLYVRWANPYRMTRPLAEPGAEGNGCGVAKPPALPGVALPFPLLPSFEEVNW